MTVYVNDKPYEVKSATNLNELAVELEFPAFGIALAIDNQIVPRAKWQETAVADQAKIIIIKAVCGG